MIYKKEVLKSCLFKLLFICLSASMVFAYSGGTGEPNSPYQIATKADLLALAANTADYGKCFILTADIDLDPNLPGGQVFTTAIIAPDTDPNLVFHGTPFTGTFDGNSHKITHFTINGPGNYYLGFLGQINSGGSVKNLGLENCSVSSSSYPAGILAGYNYGSISNCYSTGAINGSQYVGGLVGCNDYGGNISNCYSTGVVSGYKDVGGLVGENWYGSISNCYSTGAVSGSSNSVYVGGLVGFNFSGTLTSCYANGSVIGVVYVGGLVGENFSSTLTSCYANGSVIGTSNVGGLVGGNYSGTTNNSFWDVNSSGRTTSACGTGKTTVQMKTLSTFTSAGWDFVNIWKMFGGDYPRLIWEPIPYGTLQVTIEPAEAVVTGAKWRRAGTSVWHNSGDIELCIPNNYMVEFNDIPWWSSPDVLQVAVIENQTTEVNATYIEIPKGTLQVTIEPVEAVANGAKWRRTGTSTWYNSGDIELCISNNYMVEFNDIPGWSRPDVLQVAVIENQITEVNAVYERLGTESNPYLITSLADFDKFAANTSYWAENIHTKLMCDINLAGRTYTTAVIAPDTDNSNEYIFDGNEFLGSFDGNHHKITHFSINTGGAKNDFLGLFGQIGSGGAVKNLTLETVNVNSPYTGAKATYLIGSLCGWNFGEISNCDVAGSVSVSYSGYVGGLVGQNEHGIISFCHANVNMTAGDYSGFIGGLVGVNMEADINNSYSTGNVAAGPCAYIGGLVGDNSAYSENIFSNINNCYATGNVTGGNDAYNIGGLSGDNYGVGASITNSYATGYVTAGSNSDSLGGLCGYNKNSVILDCFATGNVKGQTSSYFLGGLCGYNWDADIINCYSTGSVQTGNYLGGLCGYHRGGSAVIENSFWNTATSGLSIGYNLSSSSPGAVSNVYGKTTAQMKTRSTFTDAGWDFLGETVNGTKDYWRMCVNGVNYPHLRWEYSSHGDFGCPDGTDYYDLFIFTDQWLLEKSSLVNFLDFAVFANSWHGDMTQLSQFASQWLQRSATNADIAPAPGGDGIVNFLDFALFAENWLKGN